MTEGVKAEGNIEDWLCRLQNEMQRSIRAVCREGAKDCYSQELKEFCRYPSQIALLGIQMTWTSKVQDCLEKNQKEKLVEFTKKGREVENTMKELTAMCLEDMAGIQRVKVETMVTIQVHQRDLF